MRRFHVDPRAAKLNIDVGFEIDGARVGLISNPPILRML